MIAGLIALVCVIFGFAQIDLRGDAIVNAVYDTIELNPVNGTKSFYDRYYVYRVGGENEKSLFEHNKINGIVADEIMDILQKSAPSKTITGGTDGTIGAHNGRAADVFSDWVLDYYEVGEEREELSGGVFVKLFEDMDSWFQIVYTTDDTLVTFYMTDGYSKSTFSPNDNGYADPDCVIKKKLDDDWIDLTQNVSTQVSNFVINQFEWQTDEFQTAHGYPLGQSKSGIGGTAGKDYYYNNGLNVDAPWWLPSQYEVGFRAPDDEGGEIALSMIENSKIEPERGLNQVNSGVVVKTGAYARTGLWQLNGYDRAISKDSYSRYTRSSAGPGINGVTSTVGIITYAGNTGAFAPHMNLQVCPALHLDMAAIQAAGTYPITFDANGGSNAPNAQDVVRFEKIIRPDISQMGSPNSGLVFDDWYLDDDDETPWDFDNSISGPLTLFAHWVDAPPIPPKKNYWPIIIAIICGIILLIILIWLLTRKHPKPIPPPPPPPKPVHTIPPKFIAIQIGDPEPYDFSPPAF